MKSLFLLLVLLPLVTPVARAAEVRVLAAASLKQVIAEAARSFETRNPQHRVILSTASSGTLARQIAAGAPADLFLSANPKWMNHLVQKGKVAEGQPVDWASNRLVVVGRGKPLTSLENLKGFDRIAIGSPESTPVGRYARKMLETAGVLDELDSGNRLIMGKDVWQVLLYAEQGAVDAAVIYASDSQLCQKSRVILIPEAGLQPQIVYPIALTVTGQQKDAARDFIASLQQADVSSLLKRYDFQPLF